jgi:hypothetical protein
MIAKSVFRTSLSPVNDQTEFVLTFRSFYSGSTTFDYYRSLWRSHDHVIANILLKTARLTDRKLIWRSGLAPS